MEETLKIIRYASRLALAGSAVSHFPELKENLSKLEGSIGTTRKALKLGKFLAGVQSLQQVSLKDKHAVLQIVALVGDTGYLFMQQIEWLIKMKIVGKTHAKFVSTVSAWSELIGYVASIWLCIIKQRESLEREIELLQAAQRQRLEGKWDAEADKRLEKDLALMYKARRFRTIGMLQDLSGQSRSKDSFLALADIRDSGKMLHNPALQAAAGLLSGSLSAYTKWPGVKK
ncbi:hypothetical protein QBZ16_004836 [Prototheca wickerhamii]|uniref:Uncharacterized protein n=1 Tax=Prototheca wickerhamii TaxID=3111 RepID=A0AAD9IJH5_PROWI|nr:hypothetical protein QBZ16_004836 [Prototheca wickerhamii]